MSLSFPPTGAHYPLFLYDLVAGELEATCQEIEDHSGMVVDPTIHRINCCNQLIRHLEDTDYTPFLREYLETLGNTASQFMAEGTWQPLTLEERLWLDWASVDPEQLRDRLITIVRTLQDNLIRNQFALSKGDTP